MSRPLGYSVERQDDGRIHVWHRRLASASTGALGNVVTQGILTPEAARALRDALTAALGEPAPKCPRCAVRDYMRDPDSFPEVPDASVASEDPAKDAGPSTPPAWAADVEWEPITTHRRPWPQAWQSLAPACPDGRYPVVSIRPAGGGPWLAMDVIGNLAAALNDATEGCEPDDEWEIRFGMAPIGWARTLPEHGGW